MSLRRLAAVFGLEFRRDIARPLFWIVVVILGLISWGLSTGHAKISAGDSSVGGKKAFITSEFANAQILTSFDFIVLSLFFAALVGLPILRDREERVSAMLHASALRSSEYVFGKWLAVTAVYVLALLAHLAFAMFFNHVATATAAVEALGPFELGNYLRPALLLALPGVLFMSGLCFAVGTLLQRPALVFLLPIAITMACVFWLWDVPANTISAGLNTLLMWTDPSGKRWLDETWLRIDPGVDFLNTASVPLDAAFAASRIGFAALGIGLVVLTWRRFERSLRGAVRLAPRRRAAALSAAEPAVGSATANRPLGELAMTQGRPGFVRGLLEVARVEAKGLLSHPALWLFVPLFTLEVVGNAAFDRAGFDVAILLTSGMLADRAIEPFTLCAGLLLLFYAVETLHRERASGLAAIHFSTPLSTAAYLFGKVLATAAVPALLVVFVLLGSAIAQFIQGTVPFEIVPYAIVLGLLVLPSCMLWTSWLLFLFALTGNRLTTLGLAFATFAVMIWQRVATESSSWLWNWSLWNSVVWSDMDRLQFEGRALVLNRLLAVAVAVFLTACAVRVFARRERDAALAWHRLAPRPLLGGALRLAPFAAAPLVIGVLLQAAIADGHQGRLAKKRAKDYWRKNVATWTDAKVPDIAAVEMQLEFEPERRSFTAAGSYRLRNAHQVPLARFPVTPGASWTDLSWTLDGAPAAPEDRAGLLVFQPERPLVPGGELALGFSYRATFPSGVTRDGGGAGEFVLPSGIVLTSFTTSFAPYVGFYPGIGIDDGNRHDSKQYPDDFYRAVLRTGIGGSDLRFTTKVTLTGPADMTLHSIGVMTKESIADGRRTATYESDHPVGFFNVVGARYEVARGDGTAIYYHPAHAYNVPAMLEGLNAARRWYSEWFYPYPWRELRVSEFPGLASYAQGFATNITFSESIGFLTKPEKERDLPFMVIAHEAAHQWWGNLLTPGEGPGGNILSEGMAHFSTLLLFEQVKGPDQRIEFAKRIEERYGDNRQVDSELALVKVDGTRAGDTTVQYDKGGFVAWMLLNEMGREACLAGCAEFIRRYTDNVDHPVLQDLIATLREFATDTAAFDAFVDQWYYQVVLPEFRLQDVARRDLGGGRFAVDGTLKNAGTGRVRVEVEAASRARPSEQHGAADSTRAESRSLASTSIAIGPGESVPFHIECDFEPERVVVDPDALVLQLRRKQAAADL